MTNTTSSSRDGLTTFAPPAPSIRPSPRQRRTYHPWLAPIVVGAVALAVAVFAMTSWPVGVYYDDAIYLILGKALATGEGYRYLNLPGHPAATHYPPGYPALLALLWTIAPSFPENVAVFKLANAVLLAVAAAGLFVFARRELDLRAAPAAGSVLLGCLTVPVIAVTGVLFSEPLFLAMLAFALPACERALREERTRSVVVAALLAGAVTLVRSIGLPLVAALEVGLLLRRRYRAAAVGAAVAGALLLPWQLWTAAHAGELPRVVAGSYGSYTAAYVDAVKAKGVSHAARVAANNVQELARPTGAVFAPGAGRAGRGLAVLALVALLGVGASVLARRAPATALFMAGYAAIVIVWPYEPDRFLWGLWPLVLLTLTLGAVSAARAARRARERGGSGVPLVAHAALVVAAAALALGLVRYNVRGYRQQWWETSQRAMTRPLLPFVEWVQRHTRPEDVIASDGDPLVHLYTGRLVVPSSRWAVEAYPGKPDPASRLADLRELLAAYDVRYLLLSNAKSQSAPATAVLVAEPQPRLRMVALLPGGGAVFMVLPSGKGE